MSGAIQVQNITKKYQLYASPADRLKEALHPFKKRYSQEFFALTNINLTIESGTSAGIIGLNGSGKSTLLKIISGVLTPTSGSVKVSGRISALLELGSGFNPEFTGMENLALQCSLQGFDKAKTKQAIPDILDFAEIGDFINQPVKTYSSGMYVRLAFAVAIHVEPDILIVDEALAVGDAYFQSKCLEKIQEFKSQGKTLLFVSHDPGAVKTLCDKAYLLDGGKLVDEGAPDQVFDLYNAIIAEKSATTEQSKGALAKRSGNRKIEITSVQLLNARNADCDTFVSGERVQIRINARAHENISNPTFGIMIRDRLGNDIFGINSKGLNQTLGAFKKGESMTAIYSMPLNLGPGIFNLTVAIHKDDTHIQDNYDWINNVRVFTVIPSSDLSFLGTCRLQPEFLVE